MDKFFTKYVDLLINGIIHAPKYKFWRFDNLDDLAQEARLAVIVSIHKRQWDPKKGNIFNFFTTVISRRLINETYRVTKKPNADVDIDIIYNNDNVRYYQRFDKIFLMEDIFRELRKHFSGKKKYVELTDLLEHYYNDHFGDKFIKKKFIEFTRAHNISAAVTNTFFAYLKRVVFSKEGEIQELLREDFE